ncbi:MAG TPA: MogA/MoaB family molybdenum cofactor biosynthesis protein [Terriglobales bacterium]|nr:MogA/MoaB family molybdenum cofactor biosynthesis protein [Terriglobales bacterium]
MSSATEATERTAAVLTVSDSVVAGSRQDGSGPAVAEALQQAGYRVVAREAVRDERNHIENALVGLCEQARLVVTTGGTGVATRDVTPEATHSICDREVPGIAERMRAEGSRKTPLAALSRAICATRGTSLVLNLPGSPKGATESLAAVIDLLGHALDLLAGKTEHKPSQ